MLATKVSRILKGIQKPRSSKDNSKKSSNRDKKLKAGHLREDVREIDKHLQNIRNILLYTNATPIRRFIGSGYMCAFCAESFIIPGDLKQHTLQKHGSKQRNTFMKRCTLNDYVVKLDITDLKCELCGQEIDRLEPLLDHLQSEHNKIMYTDIKNQVLPFKFEGNTLQCVICSKIFDRFKSMQEHMSVHYCNYICEICCAPHVNVNNLKGHMSRHKQGDFPCSFCLKVFDTNAKRLCHERFVHINDHKRNKCLYCDAKFTSYVKRTEHIEEAHGVEPRVLKCMACDKTFTRRDRLSHHTKRDHLLERNHECEHCGKKFYERHGLKNHMLIHTGEKRYKCDVCLKFYMRSYTLREHMRIHADDRRFKCEQCGLAFVQKCSWKSHMQTRHDENV